MHDCESDEENIIVLSIDEPNDAQIKSLNAKKKKKKIIVLIKLNNY